MGDIFETRNLGYNLRSQIDFIRTRVNTSSFELSSLKYLTTKIWDIVLKHKLVYGKNKKLGT